MSATQTAPAPDGGLSVGYKLYRDVRDYAPPRWTSGMRVVAWVIADDASDSTRRSFIPTPELTRRCGMTESGIRKTLARLADEGYEFRVSHGKGSDGRDVYAARNHPPEYMVPDIFQILVMRAGANSRPVDSHQEGGTTVPP